MDAPAKQLEKLLKQRRTLTLRIGYKTRMGDTAAALDMGRRLEEVNRRISSLMSAEHNAANPPLPATRDEQGTARVTELPRGRARFRTGRGDR